jgi:hypothetical protein
LSALFLPACAQSDPFFRAGTTRIENPTHLLEAKDFKKQNVIIKKKSVIQNSDKSTVVMLALEESHKSSTVVFGGDATRGAPGTAGRGASNPGNRL